MTASSPADALVASQRWIYDAMVEIVRDVAELEPADPDHPDTLAVHEEDLRTIIKRVLFAARLAQPAPDAQSAQQEALDAARYRWLRDSSRIPEDEVEGHLIVGDGGGEDVLWDEQLDRRIDRELASKGTP